MTYILLLFLPPVPTSDIANQSQRSYFRPEFSLRNFVNTALADEHNTEDETRFLSPLGAILISMCIYKYKYVLIFIHTYKMSTHKFLKRLKLI